MNENQRRLKKTKTHKNETLKKAERATSIYIYIWMYHMDVELV